MTEHFLPFIRRFEKRSCATISTTRWYNRIVDKKADTPLTLHPGKSAAYSLLLALKQREQLLCLWRQRNGFHHILHFPQVQARCSPPEVTKVFLNHACRVVVPFFHSQNEAVNGNSVLFGQWKKLKTTTTTTTKWVTYYTAGQSEQWALDGMWRREQIPYNTQHTP